MLTEQAYCEYLQDTPYLERLPGLIQVNIFNALSRNSMSLGLSTTRLLCEATSPFGQVGPRTPTAISYPQALSPTALQDSTPHHPWIDLLPWPVLRDRILQLVVSERIDEDDLCHDLVELDTTQGSDKASLIVWGEPWDPWGWEASRAFLRKWGWLVEGCTEILEATNHWREKEGRGKVNVRNPTGNGTKMSRPLLLLIQTPSL